MTEAVPQAAIRRRVESWLAEDSTDTSRILALRSRPEWSGEPTLSVNGATVRVIGCTTPLAARAAIHGLAADERLVLLTELDERELGDGILAHVNHQKVRSIDQWDLVRRAFGATRPDPALVAHRWAAGPLLDHRPEGGWPQARGPVLTAAHALRCLAGVLLGIDAAGSERTTRSDTGALAPLDSAGLLEATVRPSDLMRFTKLPPDLTAGIRDFVRDTGGPAAAPIMTAILQGHGADVIPLGLIVAALWSEPDAASRPGVERARALLEPLLGKLRDEQADELGGAVEAWVQRLAASDPKQAARLCRRAEDIAAEREISEQLRGSAILPSGFTHRLRDFAAAISGAVDRRGEPRPGRLQAVETALRSLQAHREAVDNHAAATAEHAARLVRWLNLPEGGDPDTLHRALLRHVQQDGWIDRAKLAVHAGSTEPATADAYLSLFHAVDKRRDRHDHQFGKLLAQVTQADSLPGAMIRVEDVLDKVVDPILRVGNRVLLLVLDGMSVAAATRLAEAVTEHGNWSELTPSGGPRTGVLAALPTVTEVSRCSLLSGRIAIGKQAEERSAFGARYCDGLLLHKGDLRAVAGSALDAEVIRAVGDTSRPLVAAVVNTIDDALDRSDPGTTDWNLHTVAAVRDLLAHAGDRVVVVVSDHGHVVDRGPEGVTRRGPAGGNRWRPATTPAGDGEVAVAGRRVALGSGSVVLPWRETLRYGPLKAGYHGGASPAEAVIPLMVFSRDDQTPIAGWASAPVASPSWWREPLPSEPTAVPVSGRRAAPSAPPSDTLFEVATPVAPTAPGHEVVHALLASKRYAQRRDRRASLPDQRVADLVGALLAGNNRATYDNLAARANVPASRIRPVVTALRKVLQVEGYPVVEIDADGETVVLNQQLLVEQFELGDA